MACWEGRDTDQWAARWHVPAVHLFRRVGSTNDVARELAADGAAAGTVVLADEQSAGRGRFERRWASPAGLGLYTSVILRPVELPNPERLPLEVGRALAEAVEAAVPPLRIRVKPPNDLLVAGRKLAGILCEAAWQGARPSFVVIGVGLNVLQRPEDFPAELRAAATSLRMEIGRGPDRAELADVVVGAVRTVAVGFPDPSGRTDVLGSLAP